MKNKFILSIVLILLLLLSSCEDFVEILPEDSIPAAIALEDLTDFEQATLGIYSVGLGYYNSDYYIAPDILADHGRLAENSLGSYATEYAWTYLANGAGGNAQAGIWTGAYSTINRANLVINNIDGLEIAAGEQETVNQLKGEALFMRAFAHFDLVRLYAKPYSAATASTDLGVPVMLESVISTPERNTVEEVYTQVIADLIQAKSLMTVESESRASALAADALLARVYLYMGDYTNAIASATTAINAADVASIGDFPDIWGVNDEDNASPEVIFKLGVVDGVGNGVGSALWRMGTDIAEWKPAVQLLDLYSQVDGSAITNTNDIRYTTYYLLREFNSTGEDVVQKYRGNDNEFSDLIVLRTAEMYLIRAEANAQSGNVNDAINDLNYLRARRISGYTDVPAGGLNQGQTLAAIAIERQKELAFEGHRFFDLKRNAEPVIRTGDCNPCGPFNADNFRFVWPIPQSELLANPSMIQNDGY